MAEKIRKTTIQSKYYFMHYDPDLGPMPIEIKEGETCPVCHIGTIQYFPPWNCLTCSFDRCLVMVSLDN